MSACPARPQPSLLLPHATDAQCSLWRPWLERAARISLRGHGNVEPNPMVGAVIVDANGAQISEGYHRKCGGAHAEVEALRRAGTRARGATAVVTLEPCNHTGRTGPCTHALLKAGIARVTFTCRDPHGAASGGAEFLREQGIEVLQVPCLAAERALAPYLHTHFTGLPWVMAKWAQTLDGCLAATPGGNRWISCERSRAMVHRERGRVDAILTGMGTVMADNPLLTARNVHARRVAARVVWDPKLELPLESQLVRTVHVAPLIVAAQPELADGPRAASLRNAGVTVLAARTLRDLLEALARDRGVSTVLVEAGPKLLSQMLAQGLVNDAWVFVAPERTNLPAPRRVEFNRQIAPLSVRLRDRDVLIHYRLAE